MTFVRSHFALCKICSNAIQALVADLQLQHLQTFINLFLPECDSCVDYDIQNNKRLVPVSLVMTPLPGNGLSNNL